MSQIIGEYTNIETSRNPWKYTEDLNRERHSSVLKQPHLWGTMGNFWATSDQGTSGCRPDIKIGEAVGKLRLMGMQDGGMPRESNLAVSVRVLLDAVTVRLTHCGSIEHCTRFEPFLSFKEVNCVWWNMVWVRKEKKGRHLLAKASRAHCWRHFAFVYEVKSQCLLICVKKLCKDTENAHTCKRSG